MNSAPEPSRVTTPPPSTLGRVLRWADEWITTLRVAPPFSRRRRELIAMSRDIENSDAWVEVERPEGGLMNLTTTVRALVYAAYELGWRNACDDHLAQNRDREHPIGERRHRGVDSVLVDLDPKDLLNLRGVEREAVCRDA